MRESLFESVGCDSRRLRPSLLELLAAALRMPGRNRLYSAFAKGDEIHDERTGVPVHADIEGASVRKRDADDGTLDIKPRRLERHALGQTDFQPPERHDRRPFAALREHLAKHLLVTARQRVYNALVPLALVPFRASVVTPETRSPNRKHQRLALAPQHKSRGSISKHWPRVWTADREMPDGI